MRFPWNRAENEMEREIAHHLNELAAQYQRRDHSRDEALRLARQDFGGSEQVKERCRDERPAAWTTGLRQDISFGLRVMRRTPVVTAAAVISLALGIGANTAIISLMDTVLWKELPVPNARQLVLVNWQTRQGFPRELADAASGSMGPSSDGWSVADFFSYPASQAMRKGAASIASVSAYSYPDAVSVSYRGRATVAQQRPVGGNFFETLQVKAQTGRLLAEYDNRVGAPPVAVVSHRFWVRELNADDRVVGRTIVINNKSFAVAGIAEPGFFGLSPGDATDLYIPLLHSDRPGRDFNIQDERYWGVSMLARKAAGVSNERLQAALNTAFRATWSRPLKKPSEAPQIRIDEGQRGLGFLRQEMRNPLLVLGGLVLLLLIIACTNIANLLLARAAARRKEVAVRVSLGCSRARMMRQFLTESALLAAIGGIASIVVAYATANLLGTFMAFRDGLPIEVSLDLRTLATAGIGTTIALLLFGLFPAWRASRLAGTTEWLKEGAWNVAREGRRPWNAGRILVLAQMAMSVVLVMAAVIFTRNLLSIESSDPGFDRRNLIIFGTRPGTSGYDKTQLPRFYFELEHRLAATPGVAQVGLNWMRPMNIGGWWESLRIHGRTDVYNASFNGVTPNYLKLYTSHLIAGRNLSATDISSKASVAVISIDLAEKLGGVSVLGKTLEMTEGPPGEKLPSYQIVGIAPSIAATSMKDRPHTVWVPFATDSNEATVVLRTTQSPRLVLPAIRKTMSEINRDLPMVDTITMEQQISKGLMRERMFATLCNGFGILALILSVVGLYGVIAFSTSRRQGEIGVRLALGATPRDVIVMILREGLTLAGIGIIAGLPVVWLGAKYLEKELFHLKPIEPLSLSVALSILLFFALLAVVIPAVRASRVQPAQALRQE